MNEPVGVALVGAAHVTHAWSYARALRAAPGARLVGVYDDDPALTAPLERDFGARRYPSAEALITDPAVAAVVTCGPTVEHRTPVLAAAAAGRHVLCEKPLATTLDDAWAMIAACDDAGVQLHVAFVSRFHRMVVRARETVRSGRLGELIALVGGNRGRPPLPPQYPAWITSVDQAGGGALIDHSVHVTDAMRHVSGQEFATVFAEADSLLWDCGVDDTVALALELDGGAVAAVDPSWSVPEGNPWDYDFFLRLVGTGGSLDIDDTSAGVGLVTPGGLRLVSFEEDLDAALVDGFLRSIVAGEVLEPCATGVDGLRALEVALAGYESAASGRRIRLAR